MVFDGLDGRVARLTRTQSPFGAEYDCLSDMVSFGVAPALVIYEWALKGMGRLGLVAAFVYCACAALRLARFNTNIDVVDKRFFQGLPSPAAAGLIAGFVWTMEAFDLEPRRIYEMRWLAWGLAVFAGLTMVSNVRFYSGKDINLRKSVPFGVVVLIALVVVVLSQVVEQPARAAVQHLRAVCRLRVCPLGDREDPQAAGAQAAPGGDAARRTLRTEAASDRLKLRLAAKTPARKIPAPQPLANLIKTPYIRLLCQLQANFVCPPRQPPAGGLLLRVRAR